MHNLHKFLFLFGMILLPFFTQNAFACSCNGFQTPYKTYKEAKAVFVGQVVAAVDASGNEMSADELSEVTDAALNQRTVTDMNYRFKIQERFKGIEASEVTVSTSINMCQFGFGVGDTYLVYAYELKASKGVLGTYLFCSRTDDIRTAQDDVHFLRALVKGKSEPRIYGSIHKYDKDPVTDSLRYNYLEGIKIVAQSGKKRYIAITDKNGLYSFHKLPNGKYKVYPKLPNKYVLDWFHIKEINLQSLDEPYPSDFERFTGRHAYSEFRVDWNNQISGKVLDVEGKPVESVALTLIPANQ